MTVIQPVVIKLLGYRMPKRRSIAPMMAAYASMSSCSMRSFVAFIAERSGGVPGSSAVHERNSSGSPSLTKYMIIFAAWIHWMVGTLNEVRSNVPCVPRFHRPWRR